MEEKMKRKSLRSTVSLSIAVSWFVLSTASAFAIIDIGPSPGGSGAGTNNLGQKPRFISNAVLVKLTPHEELNLAYSGAEFLGHLMARLKQEPNVESVILDYVVEAQFVPNDPYYSAPYPTSHYGNISQWAPQFIGAQQAWDATLGHPS